MATRFSAPISFPVSRNLADRTIAEWFNTAAFAEADGHYGR